MTAKQDPLEAQWAQPVEPVDETEDTNDSAAALRMLDCYTDYCENVGKPRGGWYDRAQGPCTAYPMLQDKTT